MDDKAALTHLVKAAGLPQPLTVKLLEQETAEAMVETLADAEQTEAVQELQPMLQKISEQDADVSEVAYDQILHDRIPKFLYFNEYYQMKGQDNLEALRRRVEGGDLEEPDHPLLGLIDLAGLELNHLVDPERTESLLANLEAAENQLTQKVLIYWSQNRHLRMKFDIRPAQGGDPAGMTTGMNIWGSGIRYETHGEHGAWYPIPRFRLVLLFSRLVFAASQKRREPHLTPGRTGPLSSCKGSGRPSSLL